MTLMVSPSTHKEYHIYSMQEIDQLIGLIESFEAVVQNGTKPMYHIDTYLRHAETNKKTLNNVRGGKVPASLLFWLLRSCLFLKVRSEVTIPHILKDNIEGKEHFFIVSKEEWQAQRDAVKNQPTVFTYTDHAKLNYLSRVLAIDIDLLMRNAPKQDLVRLVDKGRPLGDGRIAVEFGDHTYILYNNVCVSVLDKSMQVN